MFLGSYLCSWIASAKQVVLSSPPLSKTTAVPLTYQPPSVLFHHTAPNAVQFAGYDAVLQAQRAHRAVLTELHRLPSVHPWRGIEQVRVCWRFSNTPALVHPQLVPSGVQLGIESPCRAYH